MTFWQFADHNPGTFLIIVLFILLFIFALWNDWQRTRRIKASGWPPEHLDADGGTTKAPWDGNT